MDLDALNSKLPLEFRLGRRLVVAKKAELLDIHWPTVCRLELTQPIFLTLIQLIGVLCPYIKACWPEWFLPPRVILKKQKSGWDDEFCREKTAYELLKPIQGTFIPYFYGEVTYDASPALVFSAIDGNNLFYLARHKFPENKDETLRKSLKDAFNALSSYGVEYRDEKLDNILWVDEQVMIVDFEQVKFDAWEENSNSASAESLMSEFKRTRNPGRLSSYRRALLSANGPR
ncbi:hypothetical protein PHISCL_08622 [Aspergillus sclerotialis]|uniref:Phosphotransferase enzyme family n=1 Tax=Aspergillus sclerotialis TaxID=2070753 RepID=A0A3A2Z7G5_9EURO|nr:hypothetical protein PHISCL_08622 [Aspergillus sclerotialis]